MTTENQPARMGDADTITIGQTICYGDEWFRELTKAGVTFLAPLDQQDKARHVLSTKRARELSAHGGDGDNFEDWFKGAHYAKNGYVSSGDPDYWNQKLGHRYWARRGYIAGLEAATATQQPASGEVAHAGNELPRMVAYHAAHKRAADATLEANGIGGPARERAADEACRYFFNHFGDWIVPKPNAATPTPAAHGGSGEENFDAATELQNTLNELGVKPYIKTPPASASEAEVEAFIPECSDRRFWKVGVCASDNIVTYDGEDVHGVGFAETPHEIVRQHNETLRAALTRSPAAVGGDHNALWCRVASELLPPWQWNRVNDRVRVIERDAQTNQDQP